MLRLNYSKDILIESNSPSSNMALAHSDNIWWRKRNFMMVTISSFYSCLFQYFYNKQKSKNIIIDNQQIIFIFSLSDFIFWPYLYSISRNDLNNVSAKIFSLDFNCLFCYFLQCLCILLFQTSVFVLVLPTATYSRVSSSCSIFIYTH